MRAGKIAQKINNLPDLVKQFNLIFGEYEA